MNVTSVNFRSIENIYKSNRVEVKPIKNKITDSIEISQLGKMLNKASNDKEIINIDKVNEIKKQIEDGTYRVDSKALAKKIIDRMNGGK